jgi:hypothetical protein
LRANAGAGVCDISNGARAYAGLFAEEQQGVLDYFSSADRSSFIHRSLLNEPLVDPSGAYRGDARLFQKLSSSAQSITKNKAAKAEYDRPTASPCWVRMGQYPLR